MISFVNSKIIGIFAFLFAEQLTFYEIANEWGL